QLGIVPQPTKTSCGLASSLSNGKRSMAPAPSFQESTMPDRDRVPMFQPCYRIYDLVEIRDNNPNDVRSLPQVPRRKPPLRRMASWLRALFRTAPRSSIIKN